MKELMSGIMGSMALALAAHAGETSPVELHMPGVVIDGRLEQRTERRDFENGHALRYVISGNRLISEERTFWRLPTDAKVWYQRFDSGGYEAPYVTSAVGEIPVGTLIALPVTAKLADGRYAFISEADLVDYTDLAVTYAGDGRFTATYHAEKGPFVQSGRDRTPWRVCLVFDNLQSLATCDAIRELCPPPPPDRAERAKEFAVPGRCTWQWLPSGDPVLAEQKDWYDRTAALGYEYYLIDDGWKKWGDGEKDSWSCLKSVIDYGKSVGVKTAIWVDSKEMPDRESRLRYLRKVKDAGAVGIKIDFIPRCNSKWCKWYEETLADTFEFGLFVDFHGAVKPTGRERTWPHELAREAIRGHEWHVTRYRRVQDFAHDAILPFTRLVQGHADYTPVVLEPMQLMRFTRARELAQGVLFSCPFLCFGDFPKNYLESPAAEFLKRLPPTYDETQVFGCSEIGEVAAFAKRKGDEWFVGAVNGAKARTVALKFDFLPANGTYAFEGFGDPESRWGELTELKPISFTVRKGDVREVRMNVGGGLTGRLVRNAGQPQANDIPCAVTGIAASASSSAVSVFELGSPFTDGMVLQRERAVNVWGGAAPGEEVEVSFAGNTVRGRADDEGRWRVQLPGMKASKEGRTLVAICGQEKLAVGDVLVGEVWLASGQSNMDCPLVGRNTRYRDRQGALVAQMTRKPYVRFARSTGSWRREPLAKAQNPIIWKTFTPENLASGSSCSAVAAYFALDLYSALDVPVGLLCAHVGGTNIDAWTPREGTASRPDLKDILDWKYYDATNWPKAFTAYPWKSPPQQPAVLWNGLVAPLAPYSARGMIWYQGCHNFPDGEWQRYCSKMHALFNGWKQKFENEDFVIRFVQLGTSFGTLCQQQAQFEREQPAAAMAVICDVANKDDIHPNEKETVGRRLAAHALRRDYGFVDIRDNSPSVVAVTADGTNLVVTCRDAKGLYVYNDDRSLRNNFELAGADGKWIRATIVNAVPGRKEKGGVNTNGGEITDPDRIVLCAPGLKAPVKVRYWCAQPYYGAIYNEVNLPLGPFEAQVDP